MTAAPRNSRLASRSGTTLAASANPVSPQPVRPSRSRPRPPPPCGTRPPATRPPNQRTPAHGSMVVLSPPITTGSCTGKLVLATTGRRATTLVRNHFKLAPGQGDTITFKAPANLLSRLERVLRIAAKATINAHDAAKHHNNKTTVTKLTLRLANK